MKQRGNILFLILLAIILFVALSYAVNSGMRGGGNNASPEKLQTAMAEILQYEVLLDNAITRLKTSNGCTDFQISFENPVVSGYTNSNAPADKRCHLFDPAGGGLSWKVPSTAWLDSANAAAPEYGQYFFTSRQCIRYMGTAGATCNTDGLSNGALIMYLPYITQDLCQKLVAQNGTTLLNDGNGIGRADLKAVGNFTPSAALLDSAGNDTRVVKAGCVLATGAASSVILPYNTGYIYFRVLITR